MSKPLAVSANLVSNLLTDFGSKSIEFDGFRSTRRHCKTALNYGESATIKSQAASDLSGAAVGKGHNLSRGDFLRSQNNRGNAAVPPAPTFGWRIGQ